MLPYRILCSLFLLSILSLEVHAQFDEEACLSCVGSSTGYDFSNNSSTPVYCEASADTYSCQDLTAECEGKQYIYSFDCKNDIDDLVGLGATIATVIAVLSCCCCVAIVGGVAACIYCCVRGSGPPPPGVPGAYQTNPQQGAVVLPGVVPAQTGLATAVEPNQTSIPFAEAVSMDENK